MDGTQVAKLPLPRCLVGDDICYLHINTLSGRLRDRIGCTSETKINPVLFCISLVCTIFAKKKGIMDETDTQRLSQENQRGEAPVRGILEQAETVAQRVLKSIQAVAGTTDCKGVQIARLRDFAKNNKCWIVSPESLGDFADRGSENEVYLSKDNDVVYKLNDFRYSDDNLTPIFDRIKAHNTYFPDCAYTLIGFAENRDGKTCAVLSQPYIISSREATEEEIREELIR